MIYIAIISHKNEDNIIRNLQPELWKCYDKKITPVILSNLQSPSLYAYCKEHNLLYLENENKHGFGENNNKIFSYIEKKFGLSIEDYFFCINPDIQVTALTLIKIEKLMKSCSLSIGAPNLLAKSGSPEDNIRKYPSLKDMILRFLFGSSRTTYNKKTINSITHVDWASGAFLCFRADVYKRLGGFDARYFMYYEDTDICARANIEKIKTYYLPQVSATHYAQRNSRSIFSRHFYWHMRSAIRFLARFSGSQGK